MLTEPFQFADATGGDPFGDEDVAVGGEAGVVGVHEFAVFPLVWQRPQVFLLALIVFFPR